MSHSDSAAAPEQNTGTDNPSAPGRRSASRSILRRLRLPAACAALLAGAVLVSGLPAGTTSTVDGQAQSTHLGRGDLSLAANSTPVFHYNGTRWDYFAFINAIKAIVNSYNNTVPGSSNTVNHTPSTSETPNFFDVAIVDSTNHVLQMRFRRADLYLVGWFTATGTYNYIGPASEAGISSGYTGAPVNGQGGSWQLTNSPSYGALEGMAGITRGQLSFSESATGSHAANLRAAGHRELMARSILYFTQFISEAVRFRGISDTIGWHGYADLQRDNWNFRTTINSSFLAQETRWGQDSQRFNWMLSARRSDSWANHFQGWYLNASGTPQRIDMITAADYARVLATALGYPGSS